MLKNPQRACDHCRKKLRPGKTYLLLDCSVQYDIPGVLGVTPDSVRTIESKQVELHPDCASAFFAGVHAWLPPTERAPEELPPKQVKVAVEPQFRDLLPAPEADRPALPAPRKPRKRAAS
jgi:hypothetical protein